MPKTPADQASIASSIRGPRIRILSARQSAYVLTRNHVGRVAFLGPGRLELLPVHYVFADGMIIGRTSFGAKCQSWQQADIVFEVDEPESLFEWRSVIVRGELRMLTPHASKLDRADYWKAISAIRTMLPDAFTERDPIPARRVVFTIRPSELSGREASMSFLSKSGHSARGSPWQPQ